MSNLEIIGVIGQPLNITANIESSKTEIIAEVTSGARGEEGDSAYQVWLKAGNVGTEEDFLESLHGKENFIYEQIVSSNMWTINHNLNKYPSVSVVDSSGNLVVGDIDYISTSQVIVLFSAEFSGKAYLN